MCSHGPRCSWPSVIATMVTTYFLTGGILRAVLMAQGRFGAQAASGLIYNSAINR